MLSDCTLNSPPASNTKDSFVATEPLVCARAAQNDHAASANNAARRKHLCLFEGLNIYDFRKSYFVLQIRQSSHRKSAKRFEEIAIPHNSRKTACFCSAQPDSLQSSYERHHSPHTLSRCPLRQSRLFSRPPCRRGARRHCP